MKNILRLNVLECIEEENSNQNNLMNCVKSMESKDNSLLLEHPVKMGLLKEETELFKKWQGQCY